MGREGGAGWGRVGRVGGWGALLLGRPRSAAALLPPCRPAPRPTDTHTPFVCPCPCPCLLQELERALKSTCEAFIMHTTKQTVEPLLSFITKVTAARVAAQQAGGAAKPLREQVGAARGVGQCTAHAVARHSAASTQPCS